MAVPRKMPAYWLNMLKIAKTLIADLTRILQLLKQVLNVQSVTVASMP